MRFVSAQLLRDGHKPRRTRGVLVTMLALCTSTARATPPQEPAYGPALFDASGPKGPDWAFGHPAGEVALTLGSAASLAAFAIPVQPSGWAPSQRLARDDAVGMASDFTGGAIGTTWQIVGGYALDASYYQRHRVERPFARALTTTLAHGQAALLATGINEALKRLTGRCRPRAWNGARCADDLDERKAFASGHTASVSAVAGAELLLALRGDREATERWVAFGLGEAASVGTAILRVLAGAHSWEDVVGGWAIGHATGSLVSLAHPMKTLEPSAPPPAPLVSVGGDSASQAPTAFVVSWIGRF